MSQEQDKLADNRPSLKKNFEKTIFFRRVCVCLLSGFKCDQYPLDLTVRQPVNESRNMKVY